MATIEKSIDVDKPVRTVYRQWIRFEDYPSFMTEVVAVSRTAIGCLHWCIEIGNSRRECEVEITEQIPNRRVAWTSRGHGGSSGMVTLYPLARGRTRVMLQLAYASGALPRHADPVETIRELVERDLECFKKRVESGP